MTRYTVTIEYTTDAEDQHQAVQHGQQAYRFLYTNYRNGPRMPQVYSCTAQEDTQP